MMPFHRKSYLSDFLMFAPLAMLTLINQSALAMCAESGEKGKSGASSQANTSTDSPARDTTEWTRNRSAGSRAWNRAASRPENVAVTPSPNSTRSPGIRQVNASFAEDGEVSAAVASDAASTGQNLPAESDRSAPTSSLSVREQLLNALRKQREATEGAPRSLIPGSLTIMNSPTPPSQHSTTSKHLEPSSDTAGKTPVEPTTAVHSDSTIPEPLPNIQKSRIGLTQTLEIDLKSADPYVRDRAQRYLRFQMQLLKLRANQAAAAEHPASNGGPHTPESVVEHTPVPSSDVTSPTHSTDHREVDDNPTSSDSPADAVTPDVHSDEHGEHTAEQSETVHPQDDVPIRSPHSSIIENIVVDGPIDRLGLANNLFATGQYPLALEMYQQTPAADLTAPQHFWVEYQTANCLRRLGNLTEATNRYRRLADHAEAGWLSEQAHWWVETLEEICSLQKTLADNAFDQHRAAVEDVEKATQVIQNPPAPPASGPSPHKELTPDAPSH